MVVVLDEFDYMSNSAQALLRNLMETYSKNCRFILTCNYIEKVIEPIKSRCQTFEILPPNKTDVEKHISNILEIEKVKYQFKDIETIVDNSFPDVRKIINNIQLNSTKGLLELHSNSVIETVVKTKILEVLKSNEDDKWLLIRKLICDARVKDFSELYSFLYQRVDEYGGKNVPNIILLLSDAVEKDVSVVDKEISFMGCIIKITNQL